jgi:hypothetical protein
MINFTHISLHDIEASICERKGNTLSDLFTLLNYFLNELWKYDRDVNKPNQPYLHCLCHMLSLLYPYAEAFKNTFIHSSRLSICNFYFFVSFFHSVDATLMRSNEFLPWAIRFFAIKHKIKFLLSCNCYSTLFHSRPSNKKRKISKCKWIQVNFFIFISESCKFSSVASSLW